jgi:hypothetical protein
MLDEDSEGATDGLEILTMEEAAAADRAADPLRDAFVEWADVTDDDRKRLARAVEKAQKERDLQRYLEKHPEML